MEKQSKFELISSKIGVRLSIYSVILSLFFAFLCASLVLYVEHGRERTKLKDLADELIYAAAPQLAKSLWDFDEKSTQIFLSSLKNSRLISNVTLDQSVESFPVSAQHTDTSVIVPVKYSDEFLGLLSADYNFEQVEANVVNDVKLISYVLVATILLMGLFFYLIVDRSIIKCIEKISRFTLRKFNSDLDEFKPLSLRRANFKDEIYDLVGAVNQGRENAIELFKTKKDYQRQMEYQANYDLLTALPNRRNLDSYLKEQVQAYQESKGHLVIMFIDLDDFKQVNDNVGHGIGDVVLKHSATRIRRVIEKEDGYVARLGGDEFIACFYVPKPEQADIVARRVIDAFKAKVHHENLYFRLGCSIGITLYPDHQFTEPKQLILNADKALYKAKSSGKNTFFRFDERMLEELVFRRGVKTKLPGALEQNCFQVYFQPLIDINKNKIIGFEALLRWHDPELGWIRPDIFVEIAEKMGLMFDIDTWVFERAVEQVSQWREQYDQKFILSVNFSPTNFYHTWFAEWIKSDKFTRKDMTWVELEVTERLILNNDSTVIEGIRLIKSHGIRFSIDDFGVGYSSLGYIKKFNQFLSKIKIDRMFINEILSADFDIAFVKSIMMLANSLHLDVLAEGVEDAEQVTLLRQLGCHYVQGYYYSKPLPVEEIEKFIVNWNQSDEVDNAKRAG